MTHQTSRLFLERPETDHFQTFYDIYSDPETNLYNPAGPMNFETAGAAYEQILRHWARHNFGIWLIKISDTDQIAGFGGLSYRSHNGAERLNLGYRFSPKSWGAGYATELSRFAISYGFEQLKAPAIFGLVRPEHRASIRVLEKCSLEQVGRLDDVPGQPQSLIYAIHLSNYNGQ